MKFKLVSSTGVPIGSSPYISQTQLKRYTDFWFTQGIVSRSEKLKRVSNQSRPTEVLVNSKNAAHVMKFIKRAPGPVQLAAVSYQQVSRSDSSELMDHALSLLGVPYIFGGTNRSGFDCSGYTQYVFRGSGIYLPRTAAEQFKVGVSVSRDQLRSGDLVFFTTYAPGASHVGIYIDGGRFVSASNDGVSVSSLSTGYYARRYLGARRI